MLSQVVARKIIHVRPPGSVPLEPSNRSDMPHPPLTRTYASVADVVCALVPIPFFNKRKKSSLREQTPWLVFLCMFFRFRRFIGPLLDPTNMVHVFISHFHQMNTSSHGTGPTFTIYKDRLLLIWQFIPLFTKIRK